MSSPAPRRILFVEGNVDGTIGGSFFSLLFLVSGLDRSRFHATVVFSFQHRLIPRFEAAGARVLIRPLASPVQLRGRIGRLFARAANMVLAYLIEPLRLARLCREQRIDLIHLNNAIVRNHPWMRAARFARLPCITHERGINATYSAASRKLGRRLDAVICISGAVRDNFALRGVQGLKLIDIPNGLDPREMRVTQDAAAIRREFGIAPAQRLVGIVGNLKFWKGQEVVIRAMAALTHEFPDLVCLLIGDFSPDDHAYRLKVEQTIAELGLAGRVIVTGYRPNVADYVNALEILIHASVEPEPFGRVLLEGMALRKPLVASRGGAVPEIVADGVTGALFEPGNATDLALQLGRLLRDPAAVQAMGDAGYARLVEVFGIDRNTALTEQLYDRLLGSRPRV